MSALMKHDGRLKFRAHARPGTKVLARLWAKGSTRPTPRLNRAGVPVAKLYRSRAS